MCNMFHRESSSAQPIPSYGYGWKIMGQKYQGSRVEWSTLVGGHSQYKKQADGWIIWDNRKYLPSEYSKDKQCGFAFFLSINEARKAFLKWLTTVSFDIGRIQLVKIQYEQGIGKHIEDHFVGGEEIEIALAKKFKVINVTP